MISISKWGRQRDHRNSLGSTLYKKITALLLSAFMTLTLIPFMGDPIGAYADDVFEKTQDNTGLGTGSIANPASGAGGWSLVYFGKYNGNPVLYRVLDKAATQFNTNTTMLLDCNSTIINKQHFQTLPGEGYSWTNSDIYIWLNGNDFYNNNNVFSTIEKNAITASSKANKSASDGNGRDYLNFQPLVGEHVFLLDAKEVTNTSYGFASDAGTNSTREKNGTESWWWLRSPASTKPNFAGFVIYDGDVHYDNVDDYHGVSPALNINLSSVIFSSVVNGTAGNAGAKYKLTLKDTSKSVGITSGSNITRSGNTITIPYTVAGDNINRMSVLITDKAYTEADATIKSYGKLVVSGAIGTSGIGTYELPTSYASTDKVYIIAEQVGTSTVTDYAGTPVLITVPEAGGAAPGPGPAPVVKTPEKKSESSSHTHSYSWVVTKYPTSTSDGEEAYQCSCGDVAKTSILPAISAFEEEVINKIKNAPANGVVEVETRLFNSFGIGVRDALVARPDVTLKVSFLSEGYKGQLLKVTIPAGTDVKALFEESGWLGLCWYGSTHGYATN